MLDFPFERPRRPWEKGYIPPPTIAEVRMLSHAMKLVTLRAHFDGEHIHLDEPFELEPGAPVTVTFHPDSLAEPEREDWLRLAGQCFDAAYGDDEPEYPLSLIKEPNPEYEGG